MNSDALIVIYECLDEAKKISFGNETVEEITKLAGGISTLSLDSFSESFLFGYLEQSVEVVNQILLVVLNSESNNSTGLMPFLSKAMNSNNVSILSIHEHSLLKKLKNYDFKETENEFRTNIQSWIEKLSESI